MSFTVIPYGVFSPQTAISQGTTRTLLGTGATVGTENATSLACRELWIQSDPANGSKYLYVGDSTVTNAGAGHVFVKLAAGAGIVLQVSNANLIHIVADTSATVVYWGVLDA